MHHSFVTMAPRTRAGRGDSCAFTVVFTFAFPICAGEIPGICVSSI